MTSKLAIRSNCDEVASGKSALSSAQLALRNAIKAHLATCETFGAFPTLSGIAAEPEIARCIQAVEAALAAEERGIAA